MKAKTIEIRLLNIIRTLCVFMIIVLFSNHVFGQKRIVDSSKFFNPITNDITKRLPPLNVLIDSAAYNSPNIRHEDLQQDYYRFEQLTAKREWLKNFILDWGTGMTRYDSWDQDNFMRIGRYYHYWSWRNNYAVGLTIRFPLLDWVDRRNQINKQKKLIEISMMQKEINRRFLTNLVIQQYYKLVQYQNYIKIYSKYQNFLMMQMQMAQNEFLNGEISTEEYTRLKARQVSGAINFQKAISNFTIEYRLLEVTTGMKFNLINVLH